MWKQFAVVAIVLAALIPLSVQIPSLASQVPDCFVCPSEDTVGHPLGEHSNSASELFCRYNSVPNDFFCKYFRSNGLLKQDHDNGHCPATASTNCQRKKRHVLPRSPYPPSPAARSPKPDMMAVRARLGASKRSSSRVVVVA